MLKLILPILSFPRQITVTLSPKCKNILYTVDSLFGNLGNVYHSLFARCELDKCTKLFDAYNLFR